MAGPIVLDDEIYFVYIYVNFRVNLLQENYKIAD